MPALADLFKRCYLTGGSGVEFSAILLHYRGVDDICRAFGATTLTVGTDIYFRREAFAPHTPEGLRLLAHEVAHVVQQHRRPVTAGPAEISARPGILLHLISTAAARRLHSIRLG
jgi:predicted metal-dependent peptidase